MAPIRAEPCLVYKLRVAAAPTGVVQKAGGIGLELRFRKWVVENLRRRCLAHARVISQQNAHRRLGEQQGLSLDRRVRTARELESLRGAVAATAVVSCMTALARTKMACLAVSVTRSST